MYISLFKSFYFYGVISQVNKTATKKKKRKKLKNNGTDKSLQLTASGN